MEIITNAENRKELVKALSGHFGQRSEYLGPPSFAYRIGSITVDRDAKIILEDDGMEEEVRRVLFEKGITGDRPEDATETGQTRPQEPARLSIRIPIGEMKPQGLINLMNMLHSKQYLINRSIGQNGFSISDSLTETLNTQSFENTKAVIEHIIGHGGCEGAAFLEEDIIFSGFRYPTDSDRYLPYMELAVAMVRKASAQKRVNPKPTIEQNEKYYMRAWLVSLGFGGKEGKEIRNFFLKDLKGHTAFCTPDDAEKWKANRRAERGTTVCSE